MKQKFRYRRRAKGGGLVTEWPSDCLSSSELAEKVKYVGSAEHKAEPVHRSYDMHPALCSDASRCDGGIERETAEKVLREAVRRQLVSTEFKGGFPRYAWGLVDNVPHQAMLTNQTKGEYKGWPIRFDELPIDRQGRLTLEAWKENA